MINITKMSLGFPDNLGELSKFIGLFDLIDFSI